MIKGKIFEDDINKIQYAVYPRSLVQMRTGLKKSFLIRTLESSLNSWKRFQIPHMVRDGVLTREEARVLLKRIDSIKEFINVSEKTHTIYGWDESEPPNTKVYKHAVTK